MKERIKEVRKENNLTQTAFGERIGVKGNTITNYENGLRNPTDAVLLSISKEFGVNIEWLRTGNGEKHPKLTRNQEISKFTNDVMKNDDNVFKKRFLNALANLSEEQWKVIEEMFDKISNEG